MISHKWSHTCFLDCQKLARLPLPSPAPVGGGGGRSGGQQQLKAVGLRCRWVPPERILPLAPLTLLLRGIAEFLTRRGQGSCGETLAWSARSHPHTVPTPTPTPTRTHARTRSPIGRSGGKGSRGERAIVLGQHIEE